MLVYQRVIHSCFQFIDSPRGSPSNRFNGNHRESWITKSDQVPRGASYWATVIGGITLTQKCDPHIKGTSNLNPGWRITDDQGQIFALLLSSKCWKSPGESPFWQTWSLPPNRFLSLFAPPINGWWRGDKQLYCKGVPILNVDGFKLHCLTTRTQMQWNLGGPILCNKAILYLAKSFSMNISLYWHVQAMLSVILELSWRLPAFI